MRLEHPPAFIDRLVSTPIDGASLAAFRMLFGLVMAVAAIRFLALGWVDELYVLPTYHFTWDLFPWVRPLPSGLMHLHFVALAVLAASVAIGFHYRASALLFFLAFTYVELIDKTTYLNHYYLVSLLSGLLVFLPAHRVWSVDAWRRPALAHPIVPSWTVNVLRFQMAVVFLFAGLAKLNADWLLEGQPMRIWLAARSDLPMIGPVLAQSWMPCASSWFGAAYDLTIVFLLMSRRTRPFGYATVIVFHALTALLFPIGMFPWIMIVGTLIFFPPDWPRRWLGGRDTGNLLERPRRFVVPARTLALLAIYAAIQIALPLRAYWPGAEPDWTSRGFNFAWRVMLVEKAGYAELAVYDPSSGRRWRVNNHDYITDRQDKMMAQDPFMVRALARHVGVEMRARGVVRAEVRADSFASLNGRPLQRLIDPRVNLAGSGTGDWIVPLKRGGLEPSNTASLTEFISESPE